MPSRPGRGAGGRDSYMGGKCLVFWVENVYQDWWKMYNALHIR